MNSLTNPHFYCTIISTLRALFKRMNHHLAHIWGSGFSQHKSNIVQCIYILGQILITIIAAFAPSSQQQTLTQWAKVFVEKNASNFKFNSHISTYTTPYCLVSFLFRLFCTFLITVEFFPKKADSISSCDVIKGSPNFWWCCIFWVSFSSQNFDH